MHLTIHSRGTKIVPILLPLTQALGGMKKISIPLLCLLLIGCETAPTAALSAVALNALARNRATTCLTVLGHDPSPALMATLRAAKREVVPGSACANGKSGYVLADGSPAISVTIHEFNRTLPWRATADYSVSLHPLSAVAYRVTLGRDKGVWAVLSGEMLWIT
jgi:hypothetical protein